MAADALGLKRLWINKYRVERQGAVRCEKRSNQQGCEQFREGDNAALRPEAPFIHGLLKVGKAGKTRYSAHPGGRMAAKGDPNRRSGVTTIGQATLP